MIKKSSKNWSAEMHRFTYIIMFFALITFWIGIYEPIKSVGFDVLTTLSLWIIALFFLFLLFLYMLYGVGELSWLAKIVRANKCLIIVAMLVLCLMALILIIRFYLK